MKKILSLILAAVMLLSLCACTQTGAPEQTTTVATEPKVDATATDADIAKLDGLYEGRTARFGEMHAHADTGGTSDGKCTLDQWKAHMAENEIDFSTIVDHKQTIHMRLPEWDNTMFIGGSEAGGPVMGSSATNNKIHYNMLFATVEEFENLLNMYPIEFQYIGGHFGYPNWTEEKMNQLSNNIYECGGLFVHVHPQANDTYMVSDDPLDYFFGDVMGFEVLTGYHAADMKTESNLKQYDTWVKLLNLGKRAYATCGSDCHGTLADVVPCLGTIYAEDTEAKTLLEYMRAGDFSAGPAGIRLSVGDGKMGDEVSFAGNRLVVAAGEVHYQTYKEDHSYRVDVYDDQGLVFSREISGKEVAYFAIDANPDAKYYRANVFDVTDDKIIAVGNPIWNK
jgi:hypothetical protein